MRFYCTGSDILAYIAYTVFFTFLFSFVDVTVPDSGVYESTTVFSERTVGSAIVLLPAQTQTITTRPIEKDTGSTSPAVTVTPSLWVPSRQIVAPSAPPSRVVFLSHPTSVVIDPAYIDMIDRTVGFVPFSGALGMFFVEFDAERTAPRWQVSGNTLTLMTTLPKDAEFLSVFLHEFGHIVDTLVIRKDPNLVTRFAALSWTDTHTKRRNAKKTDFVSGYALSDVYEDFAESFAFYILHNTVFRDRARHNAILQSKYVFFSEYVFPNGEFLGVDFGVAEVPDYLWDVTKLDTNVKKYLFYLK